MIGYHVNNHTISPIFIWKAEVIILIENENLYEFYIFMHFLNFRSSVSKMAEEKKVKFEVGDDTDESSECETENVKKENQGEPDEERTPMNSPTVQKNRQPSPASPRLKYGLSHSDHCLSPKKQLFQPRLNSSMPMQRKSELDVSDSIVQVYSLFTVSKFLCFTCSCFW